MMASLRGLLLAFVSIACCVSFSPEQIPDQSAWKFSRRNNVVNATKNNAPPANPKLLNLTDDKSSATFRSPFSVDADSAIPLDGYTRITQVIIEQILWTVWEDLTQINGNLVYVGSSGQQRIFTKNAELWEPPANPKYPRYNGRDIKEVGLALEDLLATDMLKNGEPNEEQVKSTIPPLIYSSEWSSFVGNVQAGDVVAVFGEGYTRSFFPSLLMGGSGEKKPAPRLKRKNQQQQQNEEQQQNQQPQQKQQRQRYDGYLGGWMPAVRKVFVNSPTSWVELSIFGDVNDKDPFIVPTWHRTVRVVDGKVKRVAFGKSYPTFSKVQGQPSAAAFYTALYQFGEYWQRYLADKVPVVLPDNTWVDMTSYAFAKELVIRPGGDYPKYGAFDRDYGGSEYSGFQDIFTSSLSSNLEWGRFEQAKAVFDNYYTLMTDDLGNINMRGPEVGQFGLSLSLIAKYALYTGDTATIEKHKKRILATVGVLLRLYNESLALPTNDRGYGLLHGWSESDSCLKGDPALYWKPYYGNSGLGARGLIDIARLPTFAAQSPEWNRIAGLLIKRVTESVRANIFPNTNPPYIPPLPGVNATFREDMKKHPGNSEQDWPHRLYAELLHSNVLPADLANGVVNTIRAYGATSMGVVANVAPLPSQDTRDILGFISYGHALSLLYLDRIDEFILFLYTHRYHVHTRGAWNAGEVTGTAGAGSTYCQPSQATIPILVRWALVLEDQVMNRVYFGRGVPRAWLATGKEISIQGAPTRWGRVDYALQMGSGKVTARIKFKKEGFMPVDFEVKLRVPTGMSVRGVTVNGQPADLEKNEGVLIKAVTGVQEYVVEASL